MPRRRDFLRVAALAWPTLAWGQAKKPEGISVNDMQGQLSGTLVYKIVTPDTIEGVHEAMKLAQTEERGLCISGGRPPKGAAAVPPDRRLLDTRKPFKRLDLGDE